MPEAETALSSLVKIVTDGGVIAALVYIIYLFVSGKIFTKAMMETSIQLLASQLKESMKEAVHEGVVLASADLLAAAADRKKDKGKE